MKAHVVEDGVVVNTVIVNSLSDLPNLVEATSGGIGWTYDGSSFTDPNALTQSQLDEAKAASNRNKRNNLLAASDWTQMPDSPLTDEAKTSWATYRTSLRNLPSHSNWPNLEDNDWPTKPE
jgi:hypothetical protein